MRTHPATTPLHTATTVCPEKTVGGVEMWEMMAQAWPPSNTWVKLIARRLAQQIKRRNRQTGSPTADSPRNLSIQTRQSRHHHRTVQHTVLQQQWCHDVIPPPSPSNDVIQCRHDRCVWCGSGLHPHIFPFYARKSPQAVGPGVEHKPE